MFDRVTSPANFFGRCRLKLLLPRPASSLAPFFHEILTHLPIVLEIWVAPPCNMPSKFENSSSSSPSAPSPCFDPRNHWPRRGIFKWKNTLRDGENTFKKTRLSVPKCRWGDRCGNKHGLKLLLLTGRWARTRLFFCAAFFGTSKSRQSKWKWALLDNGFPFR